jgi:hypothetical protein
LISTRTSWAEPTPRWAALAIAPEIAEIMSSRAIPFSFSMYSRTDNISWLIVGKK